MCVVQSKEEQVTVGERTPEATRPKFKYWLRQRQCGSRLWVCFLICKMGRKITYFTGGCGDQRRPVAGAPYMGMTMILLSSP